MAMGEDILVIRTKTLFKDKTFQGFLPSKEFNFFSVIMNNFEYLTRTPELEEDSSIQQPIPYVWIINKNKNKVFLYKRSKSGNEGRLHEKISGGVGGHIDKNTEQNSDNPIIDAMMRELEEEVKMDKYPHPEIIGYINLPEGVEEVHFGIVAVADTTQEVLPKEDMSSGKFYSLEEVDSIFNNPESDIERWSKESWPHIKEIISNS